MNKSVKPAWRRSSKCSNGTCVEVAKVDDVYLLRDSKSPGGKPLRFSADEWAIFKEAIVRGEFDFR